MKSPTLIIILTCLALFGTVQSSLQQLGVTTTTITTVTASLVSGTLKAWSVTITTSEFSSNSTNSKSHLNFTTSFLKPSSFITPTFTNTTAPAGTTVARTTNLSTSYSTSTAAYQPIDYWDLSLSTGVVAAILLVASELLSPYYGRARFVLSRKRLRMVGLVVALIFLGTLVYGIYEIVVRR